MSPADDVLQLLGALRWRLGAQRLAGSAARGGLLLAGVLVVLAAADWLGWRAWSVPALCAVCSLGVVAVVISTLRSRLTLAEAARIIDRKANTRDRFSTALAFSSEAPGRSQNAGVAHDLRALALRECALDLGKRDFARVFPWRWPRELRWLWVPLLTVAILRIDARQRTAARLADEVAAAKVAAPMANHLQKLASDLSQRPDSKKNEALQRLAAQLRESAERLRAGSKDAGEAEKARLREVSALEDLVREMQDRVRAQLAPDELKAVAEALRENPPTAEAGQKIDQGDLAGAAQRLEAEAQKLGDRSEERSAEQIKRALQAALDRLVQQRQLSEGLRKMQNGQGSPSETMQKLAQLLRDMPRQQGGEAGSAGAPPSPKALQNLLSSLENLKRQPGDAGGGNKEKGGASQLFGSATQPPEPELAAQMQLLSPSGRAGSEHDQGTTDTPFGQKPQDSTPKSSEAGLQGQLGRGPTASQMLPGATGDDSKARRGYKALYDAMAPAAEDAVMQENIPLASRFFVQRYFEAIRPKD